MKKLVLLGLALSVAMGVQAAKPAAKAATKPAPKAAAEPSATPEVKTTDAPEVTYPDLKEAMPAMRQGTEEPLGGYRDRGLKDRSAWTFGVASIGGAYAPKLGHRYWMHDSVAWQAALGGSYAENSGSLWGNSTFSSSQVEELGLRFKVAPLGQAGFAFIDLGLGASQSRLFETSRYIYPTYTQFRERIQVASGYGASVRGGAELFWPGSRSVSFEAGGGLHGNWRFIDDQMRDWSDDGVSGTNAKKESLGRTLDFGTNLIDFFITANLYY